MKKNLQDQSGQSLVILLVYMIIAIVVTTASVALVLNSALGTNIVYRGISSLDIAESGVENAIIRLIRNPDYTGETIAIDGGQAVVTITGTSPTKTIVSRGTLNSHTRTIQVVIDTTNNTISVTSWREI